MEIQQLIFLILHRLVFIWINSKVLLKGISFKLKYFATNLKFQGFIQMSTLQKISEKRGSLSVRFSTDLCLEQTTRLRENKLKHLESILIERKQTFLDTRKTLFQRGNRVLLRFIFF